MGQHIFDQYSLLHFASGVIAYFWGISLPIWIIIHTAFEIFQNSCCGMEFINHALKNVWPGGHQSKDTIWNSVGDTITAILGWLCAYWLDTLGKKHEWYTLENITN